MFQFSTYIFLIFGSLLSGIVSAQTSLNSDWQNFVSELWEQDAEFRITNEQLHSRANADWLPEVLLPDLKHFQWADIQLLYSVHQTCRIDTSFDYSEPLRAAAFFEQSLCESKPLPLSWFQQNERRHPSGGSYAARYLEAMDSLDPAYKKALSELTFPGEGYLGIRDKLAQYHLPLEALRLMRQHNAYLNADTRLWLATDSEVALFTNEVWRPLAAANGLDLLPLHDQDDCSVREDLLCLQRQPSSLFQYSLIAMTALSALLAVMLLLRMVWNKRQELKERRFILQLLTHELRTPVASLGLSIELFRERFDHLPESLQEACLRLLSDYQRLQLLVKQSEGYLGDAAFHSQSIQVVHVSEWIEALVAPYDVEVEMQCDGEPNRALPWYWLGICVDNLLRNAQEHGASPIRLRVHIASKLTIEVLDAGEFSTLSVAKAGTNMGLGMTLVQHIMKKLGGQMRVKTKPTRILLEYPL